jgi:hypothetical protein
MELSDLEIHSVGVPLHLRKSLEDGGHSIHTFSGGSSDQDGHEKRTRSPPWLRLPSTVQSLKISLQFIMDTLIDQFELQQTGRFRGVVNADDVVAILHYHWVLCDDYYPEERQRLQHAIMNVFCSSTTHEPAPLSSQAVTLGGTRLLSMETLNCTLSETTSTRAASS